jgi:hypothetical protein
MKKEKNNVLPVCLHMSNVLITFLPSVSTTFFCLNKEEREGEGERTKKKKKKFALFAVFPHAQCPSVNDRTYFGFPSNFLVAILCQRAEI